MSCLKENIENGFVSDIEQAILLLLAGTSEAAKVLVFLRMDQGSYPFFVFQKISLPFPLGPPTEKVFY